VEKRGKILKEGSKKPTRKKKPDHGYRKKEPRNSPESFYCTTSKGKGRPRKRKGNEQDGAICSGEGHLL